METAQVRAGSPGPFLAAMERDGTGQPIDPVDGEANGSCPQVHSVPRSDGTLENSRSLVRQFLVGYSRLDAVVDILILHGFAAGLDQVLGKV